MFDTGIRFYCKASELVRARQRLIPILDKEKAFMHVVENARPGSLALSLQKTATPAFVNHSAHPRVKQSKPSRFALRAECNCSPEAPLVVLTPYPLFRYPVPYLYHLDPPS